MTEPTREEIFTRQEQGVVYLFSRYWDRIEQFKGKRISRIHTHFPDFSLRDVVSGAAEAVERLFFTSPREMAIPRFKL